MVLQLLFYGSLVSPEAALGDVLRGCIAGLIAAGLGYLKSCGEKFDLAKFAKTTIFGGVVGIVAAWKGTNMDEAEKWASMVGISLLFSFLWDAFVRKVLAPGIRRILQDGNRH